MNAECGIPICVIIDPSTGICTIYRHPTRTGTCRDEDEVPFGQDLVLPLEGRDIVVTTDGFPVADGSSR
ncbi:hypothetical protein ACIQZB_12835 [Streptomyces sp. NPDC097727]|uniref:hypothetical protein n=1 Tax=Streptomyces sp. NPDC097727 TaxID=3366092 RepID=UPI0038015273